MTCNNDRPGTAQGESVRIGLCLAAPRSAAREAPGIQRFSAQSEIGAVLLTLTLTQPPVTTFSRLVIRFRADGRAPSSPADGSPLFDEPALPGAMYGNRHSGLSPEHTYVYAAFVLDALGVVRVSTTAVGRPLAMQPPAIVQGLRRDDAGCAPQAASSAGSGP
jgi:hypothetical protein